MRFYINASFNNADTIPDWLKKDKGALRVLNNNGYDLYNLSLKPKKTGKLNENLVIYYIHDPNSWRQEDFIWIPGLYNDTHSMRNPRNDDWTDVKYIAKKNLDIRGVLYAVKEDSRKPERERYVDPRYSLNDGYSNYKQPRYMGQYKDKRTNSWSSKGARDISWDDKTARDKSGYKIPKPDDRLANYYSGFASGNLDKKINDTYEELQDLKEDLFSLDIDSYFERNDLPGYYSTGDRAYSELFSQFTQAVRDYKSMLKQVESLKELPEQNKVGVVKNILNKIKDIDSKIKYARRLM